MKNILLSICLLLSAMPLGAQSASKGWEKFYNGNSDDLDSFDDVILDGNFVVAVGRIYQDDDYKTLIAKFDLNGNQIWAKISGIAGLDLNAYYIQKGANGNYYVLGYANSGEHFISSFNSATGASLAIKAFNFFINDFVALPDGSFMLAGERSDDPTLFKYDQNLNELWAKPLNFTFAQGFQAGPLYAVSAIPGGGFYVLARGVDLFSSTSSGDVVVGKTDAQGNLLWSKAFGGTKEELFADSYSNGTRSHILATADGGFAFVVSTKSPEYVAVGQTAWVVKGSSDGTLQWWKTPETTITGFANGLAIKPNGNLVVFGRGGTNMFNVPTDKQVTAFAYELNKTSGQTVWKNCFGGLEDDVNRKIVALNNNKLFAVGTYDEDAWVYAINIDGITAAPELPDLIKMKVAPNPAAEFVQLQFEERFTGIARIQNPTGQTVFEQNLDEMSASRLEISTLDPGIYFLQIIEEKQPRHFRTIKLVVQ